MMAKKQQCAYCGAILAKAKSKYFCPNKFCSNYRIQRRTPVPFVTLFDFEPYQPPPEGENTEQGAEQAANSWSKADTLVVERMSELVLAQNSDAITLKLTAVLLAREVGLGAVCRLFAERLGVGGFFEKFVKK